MENRGHKKGWAGTLEERFMRKFVCNLDSGCWPYIGHLTRGGYGLFSVASGTARIAHRLAYELFIGPIPEGHDLHHNCENRRCVNPDHLQPLLRAKHLSITERWAGNKSHCLRGHELTPENTSKYAREKRGVRQCAICQRMKARDWYARNREKALAKQREYYLRRKLQVVDR